MPRTRRRPRHGFTIIEVIVIVVIIGVLAAVIAPRLFSRVGQSRQSVARSNAATLANAVRLYFNDHGKPEAGATLSILWEKPPAVTEGAWEPYVESPEALIDPWGNPYILVIPGQKNFDFDIVSYGKDGQPGGEGEDADIIIP